MLRIAAAPRPHNACDHVRRLCRSSVCRSNSEHDAEEMPLLAPTTSQLRPWAPCVRFMQTGSRRCSPSAEPVSVAEFGYR